MRRVAFAARCLAGGAIAWCLCTGLTPALAQEAPVATAALAKPAPAPTPAVTPAAAPTATATATATVALATARVAFAAPANPPATRPPAPKKDSCAGVIGTSRTIVVDPHTLPRIGHMQYKASLPLNDHEVVLTFDDGPIHTYTPRVLDTLAANCVKATFFLVGSMAQAYPRLVRRIYNEGHSIGTHSQDHPLTFSRMTEPAVAHEVDAGIVSVEAAVGNPRAVAPFFRVPGLLRSKTVDSFLAEHALAVWSADEVADDWHHGITARQIVRLAMKRIAADDHRGVLLLHDIHPATAEALPVLLAELKKHGYHIVHVIPPGAQPKSVPPLPPTVVAHAEPHAIKSRHHWHRPRHGRLALHRHHRLRSHVQSLSARSHKRHRMHAAARDTTPASEW